MDAQTQPTPGSAEQRGEKPYAQPRLTEFGSLSKLTQSKFPRPLAIIKSGRRSSFKSATPMGWRMGLSSFVLPLSLPNSSLSSKLSETRRSPPS